MFFEHVSSLFLRLLLVHFFSSVVFPAARPAATQTLKNLENALGFCGSQGIAPFFADTPKITKRRARRTESS